MNVKQFSDALSELDAKYIDEAISYRHKAKQISRSHRRLTVALIAAILALLLIGCVTAATGVFGTRIKNLFTSYTEPGTDLTQSGFDLDVAIKRIPMRDFTGEIQQVGAKIKQQFQDYKLYYNWHPAHWQANFSSYEKACAYIGFDSLKQIDLNLEEQTTTLRVLGDENGQILYIALETYYSINEIRVQHDSQIFTEYFDGEIVLGSRTTEHVEFEESFYINDNKKQCHIIDSTALESGYRCMDGYIVDHGVLYNLHIAYQQKDSEQTIDLLHFWANQF